MTMTAVTAAVRTRPLGVPCRVASAVVAVVVERLATAAYAVATFASSRAVLRELPIRLTHRRTRAVTIRHTAAVCAIELLLICQSDSNFSLFFH